MNCKNENLPIFILSAPDLDEAVELVEQGFDLRGIDILREIANVQAHHWKRKGKS